MTSHAGLQGKAIIVTGAGKGLGRAYALYLAATGAKIVVNNRRRDPDQPATADAVVAEIRAAGGDAVASHRAVEDPSSGEAMVRLALDTYGRLDGVIANAGVPEAASFGRMSLNDFRAVFDVNFFGTLHLVHAAWKVLIAQKRGRMVVSTSAAGLHGNRGMAAYSASKAALIGLMRALALEGTSANVLINALAPYATTAMTLPYVDAATAAQMSVDSVAPLAAWLVSDACDVTGRIVIAGAGGLRTARMVEGPLVALGQDVEAAVQKADIAGPGESFADANAAFEAFLAGASRPG